jgi:hypothetical protein
LDSVEILRGNQPGTDANSTRNSQLILASGNNTWNLTATNTGTVAGITFEGFNQLQGGTGNDTFNLDFNLVGGAPQINGQAGNDNFTLGALTSTNIQSLKIIGGADNDEANYANVTGDLRLTLGQDQNINSVETIIGNNATNSELVSNDNNTHNTWTINGDNIGSVTYVKQTVSQNANFTGFKKLTGGAGNDDFILQNTGKFTGLMNAGTGTNSLSVYDQNWLWNINLVNNTTTLNTATTTPEAMIANILGITQFIGGANTDQFNFTGTALPVGLILDGKGGTDTANYAGITGNIEIILGNTGLIGIETIIGNNNAKILASNNDNIWNITNTNKGSIIVGAITTNFENMSHLTGGSGKDDFILISANNITGSITGGIDGGEGSNSLTGINDNLSWIITKDNNALETYSGPRNRDQGHDIV